jgi:hypothetical protein
VEAVACGVIGVVGEEHDHVVGPLVEVDQQRWEHDKVLAWVLEWSAHNYGTGEVEGVDERVEDAAVQDGGCELGRVTEPKVGTVSCGSVPRKLRDGYLDERRARDPGVGDVHTEESGWVACTVAVEEGRGRGIMLPSLGH